MRELRPWLRLLWTRWPRLIIGGLLMFATVLAGVGLLALSGWFITATALTGLLIAAGVKAYLDIYTPGGGIRFFALARTVSRYVERLYNHDTVLRLLADVRVTVFAGLSGARREQLNRRRPSDWLNRLTADIDALDTLYLRLIAPPAIAVIGLVLGALIMLAVAPALLWSLLPLALLPAVLYLLARRTLAPSRDLGEQTEALRAGFVDTIEGSAELQAAHLWEAEVGKVLQSSRALDRTRLLVENQTALADGLTVLAVQLSVVIAMLVGLSLWDAGHLSGPVALLFTLAVLGLGEAFTGLPAAFSRLGTTLGAALRLNQDTQTSAADNESACPATGPLRLSGAAPVRNGETLTRPLSLTVPMNHRLAIVGRSGSGKSTLLDILAGLHHDWTGEIMLGDGALSPNQAGPLGREVSYLTQHSYLFSDTVAANLRIASPDATDEELLAVLDAVALAPLVKSLPAGLNTRVGDQGRGLSGGERRRLALARALMRPSRILLLDEPFTGVDTATIQRIKTSIEPWLEGRTCIFAGHALSALPDSDLQIELNPSETG